VEESFGGERLYVIRLWVAVIGGQIGND